MKPGPRTVEAYRKLLEAAASLDVLEWNGDLGPWRRYLRAYFRWIDALRFEEAS